MRHLFFGGVKYVGISTNKKKIGGLTTFPCCTGRMFLAQDEL